MGEGLTETTVGKLVNIACVMTFGCIFVGRSGWKPQCMCVGGTQDIYPTALNH